MLQLRGRRSIKDGKSSVRECLQASLSPFSLPSFFFLREFFSLALLSERLEQSSPSARCLLFTPLDNSVLPYGYPIDHMSVLIEPSSSGSIYFSEHLYWEEHVHNLSKSCYSVLGILRKIKKLKTYLTITLEKLKLSRPVWLGTGWILRCEYRREGAYFFLSFVLILSVLSKLKRTLEKLWSKTSSSVE